VSESRGHGRSAPALAPPGLNGAHDVGGLVGLGPIPIDGEERPFHERWQGRVVALTLASVVRRLIGVDQQRAEVEAMHPVEYMAASYYERWLRSLERNLVANGALKVSEIEERLVELAERPDRSMPAFDEEAMVAAVKAVITGGITVRRAEEVGHEPRFEPGDAVRTRVMRIEKPGLEHTRLPGYAQGKAGVVEILHPPQPRGDDIVAGREAKPEFVYSVRFRSGELWPGGHSSEFVNVDVWESYMDPLEESR
jgi:nitrile hydratase beta subunit